ncbi:MAG: hypothetical protein OIF58_00745 [Cohaesibacter sp.]|nr:hypothetical protein [Cohaesibacter sp.]
MFDFKKTFKINALSLCKRRGGLNAFALALILFALSLRAALPLGLAITVNEDGIPLVICQQVASVATLMAEDEQDQQKPPAPSYKCPYCMVLSADGAALANLLDMPATPDWGAFLSLKPLKREQIVKTEPTVSDNLGRDPPKFA